MTVHHATALLVAAMAALLLCPAALSEAADAPVMFRSSRHLTTSQSLGLLTDLHSWFRGGTTSAGAQQERLLVEKPGAASGAGAGQGHSDASGAAGGASQAPTDGGGSGGTQKGTTGGAGSANNQAPSDSGAGVAHGPTGSGGTGGAGSNQAPSDAGADGASGGQEPASGAGEAPTSGGGSGATHHGGASGAAGGASANEGTPDTSAGGDHGPADAGSAGGADGSSGGAGEEGSGQAPSDTGSGSGANGASGADGPSGSQEPAAGSGEAPTSGGGSGAAHHGGTSGGGGGANKETSDTSAGGALEFGANADQPGATAGHGGNRAEPSSGVRMRDLVVWRAAKFQLKGREAQSHMAAGKAAAAVAHSRASALENATDVEAWTGLARSCVDQMALVTESVEEAAGMMASGGEDVNLPRIHLSNAVTLALDCAEGFDLFAPGSSQDARVKAVQEAAMEARASVMEALGRAADMAAMIAAGDDSAAAAAAAAPSTSRRRLLQVAGATSGGGGPTLTGAGTATAITVANPHNSIPTTNPGRGTANRHNSTDSTDPSTPASPSPSPPPSPPPPSPPPPSPPPSPSPFASPSLPSSVSPSAFASPSFPSSPFSSPSLPSSVSPSPFSSPSLPSSVSPSPFASPSLPSSIPTSTSPLPTSSAIPTSATSLTSTIPSPFPAPISAAPRIAHSAYHPHSHRGTGWFRELHHRAVGFKGRYVVFIQPGFYREKVLVNSTCKNVTLLGTGAASTVISWYDNATAGTGTFQTPTVAVEASGFAAIGIRFENTAGKAGNQAVAFRQTGDNAAFYECEFIGWQDTLYVHGGRQYYRNCYVNGTVDFVFGNGATVMDNCTVHIRSYSGGTVTASGRTNYTESTGIVILNSIIKGDLANRTYLGRPWKPYARVAVINTTISNVVCPPLPPPHSHFDLLFPFCHAAVIARPQPSSPHCTCCFCLPSPQLNTSGWLDWGSIVYSTSTFIEQGNSGPGSVGPRIAWATPGIVTDPAQVAMYYPNTFLAPFSSIANLIPFSWL
ncbi:unnamed protein product [Closterium sp. Naga37s-1]|nr:unnamed protein product [Closterium sp. Naga37s-1]